MSTPAESTSQSPPRCVVVVPTFNHGHAVRNVLDALAPLAIPIIVIDDGSRDNTANTLSDWAAINPTSNTVLTHQINQGKAAALLTGFAAARKRGFTHALTIDSDGQHNPQDLRTLQALATSRPEALVVGARPRKIPGYPWTGRFGRWFSNRCIWLASGLRVTDSQSGLRCYPLALLEHLAVRAGRYAFETEILTRAAWANIPVIEAPIGCIYEVPEGRRTHFRIAGDSWAAIRMHTRLVARALIPGNPVPFARPLDAPTSTLPPGSTLESSGTGSIPARLWAWLNPLRIWAMVRGDTHARQQLAASVAVGLFLAPTPIYGAKTAVCLWLAARFRLHPAAVIAACSLSTPPIGFVLILASVVVGHSILHASAPTLQGLPAWNHIDWSTLRSLIGEWIVGSIVFGGALALLAYAAIRALLKLIPAAQESGNS